MKSTIINFNQNYDTSDSPRPPQAMLYTVYPPVAREAVVAMATAM